MTIKKVDIPNFGSFKGFNWNQTVTDGDGAPAAFKKVNILYGRNYSGKTTLSRVIRSLEVGELPVNYQAPEFSVTTDAGAITQAQIPSQTHIRVYNRDFVESHLAFGGEEEGDVTPFAVIGSKNNAIEAEIAQLEGQLGSVEAEAGLRHRHAEKHAEYQQKLKNAMDAHADLEGKLRRKANDPPDGIKHNTLYNDPNYNISKIKTDIETVRNESIEPLDNEARREKEDLLQESPLPLIETTLEFAPSLLTFRATSQDLLAKKIVPTQPIQELLNDALLQEWVRGGIPHHRDRRDTCAFCGQRLPEDLWKKLDEHFSQESDQLRFELNQHIQSIQAERERATTILTIEQDQLYSGLHTEFTSAKTALDAPIDAYNAALAALVDAARARSLDIFSPGTVPALTDNTAQIETAISSLNTIVERNNQKTSSLAEDQRNAKAELRLSEIATFIKTIDLEAEEEKVARLRTEASGVKVEADALRTETEEAEKKISNLQVQLKDEKRGAEKVNQYLNHYFGHEGLRLQAIEDSASSVYKFQIQRGDEPAYDLSEGERSLVAFCYFMAKLEDADSKQGAPIIYIDDPISSLDSNHIYFVFSLIEDLIARPPEGSDGSPTLGPDGKPNYSYEQLFVSTHNLEFLKFLRKLTRLDGSREYFHVIGKGGVSTIELMPKYLRKYVTEFNYLFGEIYTCIDPANAASKYDCFYNFGNNLRKFLEAFLFFKYPFLAASKAEYNERIRMFFKGDDATGPLVQRLTAEFSHLGDMFDRSVQPIECAEISKVATFVLGKIRDNDPVQFKCLLESIEQPDPFDKDD